MPKRLFCATLAVAGVYAYFLIFPQFAFLHALRAQGVSPDLIRALMGLMAVGGMSASWWAGRSVSSAGRRLLMLAGAGLGMVAAGVFAAWSGEAWLRWPVALVSGGALGLMTVSLAAFLREFAGRDGVLPACGFGTGIAYAVSNLPPLFNASPAVQAGVSVAFAGGVAAAVFLRGQVPEPESAGGEPPLSRVGFRRGLVLFLLLIWLDSACFAVIQETEVLRLAAWGPDLDLLCNGAVHALTAFATGLLYRGRPLLWLTVAGALLTVASGFLIAGGDIAARAHLLYAGGVSVYSTLLVAWLPLAHGAGCSRRVAVLYSVAGWLGSALGIGMALDLHRIPVAFLVFATGAVAWAWLRAWEKSMEGGTRHG